VITSPPKLSPHIVVQRVSWRGVLAGVTIALVTQLMLNLIGMGVAPSVGAVRLEVNLQLIAMHTEGKREASSQLRRSSPQLP
jgi:hypothetical protein